MYLFFFFNDTATTEIYTLSLHDALPIWNDAAYISAEVRDRRRNMVRALLLSIGIVTVLYLLVNLAYLKGLGRSEEHTSELQSQSNLVCRLLLEKKKNTNDKIICLIVYMY